LTSEAYARPQVSDWELSELTQMDTVSLSAICSALVFQAFIEASRPVPSATLFGPTMDGSPLVFSASDDGAAVYPTYRCGYHVPLAILPFAQFRSERKLALEVHDPAAFFQEDGIEC
jgi:hypothetical protein